MFTGNELGALFGWWMWLRAQQRNVDPKKCVMISSTVSSKILESMSKKEGFAFEETLTGLKWMANRGLQMQKEGYETLFAFEGMLSVSFIYFVNIQILICRGNWIHVRDSRP